MHGALSGLDIAWARLVRGSFPASHLVMIQQRAVELEHEWAVDQLQRLLLAKRGLLPAQVQLACACVGAWKRGGGEGGELHTNIPAHTWSKGTISTNFTRGAEVPRPHQPGRLEGL